MPSTFTPNTGIEKIADGEQSGLWGQTTNLNFDIVDRALNGSTTITLSGTTHTLTTASGVLSAGQFAVLVFAGSPSGTNTVTIAPNTAQKTYLVRNTTSQTVVLSQGSGATVSILWGRSAIVDPNGPSPCAAVFAITQDLAGNPVFDTRQVATSTGLTGGGDLTADRTLALTGQALALHNLATSGVIARTGAGTVAGRTITAGTGISITNGDGVAGNPVISATNTSSGTVTSVGSGTGLTGGPITTTGTLALTGQALALHNLATNGIIARTGAGTVAGRTLTAGTGISITNGDGVSGNPTVATVGLTQAQAEDPASTVFGTVSGQRLAQAVEANGSVTTTSVLNATAGATAGGVGTYAFLRDMTNSTTNIDQGTLIAGANLRFASSTFDAASSQWIIDTGQTPSGTWMLLGYGSRSIGTTTFRYASLFLRVS